MPPRPEDPRTDQELITAINRGEDSAFDALYYRYRDRVASLAMRFTESHEDALDVVQETFLYLAGKFPGFVLTAQMTTLLYRVVRSLSLETLRKRRPAMTDDQLLDIPAQPAPNSCPADLAEILAALPSGQRQVLVMRFVDGLDMNEIAQVLEIPVGTVKSRLHNAIAALRENPRARRYFF